MALPTTRALAVVVLSLVVSSSPGCGGDACEDLRPTCDRCPDDDQGRTARESCLHTVDSGDQTACEDRIEQNTYEAFGCR